MLFGEQAISFPRPFMFTLRLAESHLNHAAAGRLARVMCLYDNAGESFLPGQDTAVSQLTRHLALSRSLMFLFYRNFAGPPFPPRLPRKECRPADARSLAAIAARSLRAAGHHFAEAAQRVRRYAGLSEKAKHSSCRLIVVVTKYDCWLSLLEVDHWNRRGWRGRG